MLAWGDYRRAKAERAPPSSPALEARARRGSPSASHLLDPANADPDLVEELVRSELGLIRPDEVIIPLDDEPATRPATARR